MMFYLDFIIWISLLVVGFVFYMLMNIYLSDPEIRKTKEFIQATNKMPDVWPGNWIHMNPGSGITMIHIAFLLIKKKNKTVKDIKYIVHTTIGTLIGIVTLAYFIYLMFKGPNA